MKFSREWAMPDSRTFRIAPIAKLIERYIASKDKPRIVDPFANDSPFNRFCWASNDLYPGYPTTHHMEALDFLKSLPPASCDIVLFDPPYSPRQIAECYKSVGRSVHMEDTQIGFYSARKTAAAKLLRTDGIAITAGWNSNGFGESNGCQIEEILLVAHGSAHNDTIVVVERKTSAFSNFFSY